MKDEHVVIFLTRPLTFDSKRIVVPPNAPRISIPVKLNSNQIVLYKNNEYECMNVMVEINGAGYMKKFYYVVLR